MEKKELRHIKIVDSANINWAYIAGFFDGEGSIVMSTKGRDTNIGCRLSITNTNYEVLKIIDKFLQSNGIKGQIGSKPDSKPISHDNGKTYGQTKPCYNWRVGHRIFIIKFLVKTLPYLIVKKQKALEAISYIEWVESPEREVRRRTKISLGMKGKQNTLGYRHSSKTKAKISQTKRRIYLESRQVS